MIMTGFQLLFIDVCRMHPASMAQLSISAVPGYAFDVAARPHNHGANSGSFGSSASMIPKKRLRPYITPFVVCLRWPSFVRRVT